MTNKYQLLHSFIWNEETREERHSLAEAGKEYTGKRSFKTLGKAIEKAETYLDKTKKWDFTTTHIEIIDKDTKKVLYTKKAE